MSWWWLSFCDVHATSGNQLLGVCVVQAEDIPAALDTAWEHQCNPGGEVLAIELDDDGVPAEEYRNRLLTREEAEHLAVAKHAKDEQP